MNSVNSDDAVDGAAPAPARAPGEPARLPSVRPADGRAGSALPSPERTWQRTAAFDEGPRGEAIEGRFVVLSPGSLSPQRARASLRWLGGHLDGDGLAAAFLVASELVTNAVVHTTFEPEQDWIRVEAVLLPGCVRIEVSDSGPGFEPGPPRLPPPGAANGRGLWLLARLADRWGHDLPDVSRIWFELDREEDGDRP